MQPLSTRVIEIPTHKVWWDGFKWYPWKCLGDAAVDYPCSWSGAILTVLDSYSVLLFSTWLNCTKSNISQSRSEQPVLLLFPFHWASYLPADTSPSLFWPSVLFRTQIGFSCWPRMPFSYPFIKWNEIKWNTLWYRKAERTSKSWFIISLHKWGQGTNK